MFNGSKKLELRTVGTIRSVFGIADHTDARPRIAVLTEEDLVPLKSGLMEQTPQESSAVKWQVGVVTEYR